MPYPLPKYLDQPTDTAEQYLQGYRIGSEMKLQQQRMAQQAQMAQLDATLKVQSEQARMNQEMHRMGIDRARDEATLGLKQSEMELEAKEAAARSADIMSYQQELATPGADPIKAMLKYPRLFGTSGAGLATAARALSSEQGFKPSLADVPGLETGKVLQIGPGRSQYIPNKTVLPEKPPDQPGVIWYPRGNAWVPHNLPKESEADAIKKAMGGQGGSKAVSPSGIKILYHGPAGESPSTAPQPATVPPSPAFTEESDVSPDAANEMLQRLRQGAEVPSQVPTWE